MRNVNKAEMPFFVAYACLIELFSLITADEAVFMAVFRYPFVCVRIKFGIKVVKVVCCFLICENFQVKGKTGVVLAATCFCKEACIVCVVIKILLIIL